MSATGSVWYSLRHPARALELEPGAWRQGLRLAIAAWSAFSIAALLGIDNPFWAAMPIWVVSQPLRGLLIERAVYRVLGTLGGAAVGFAILQIPSNAFVQLAVLAVWVGICAGWLHLIRTVASYAVLMLGLTAAVVLMPAVLIPDMGYELAKSRVLCTLIGAVVVTLFTAYFTPKARRDDYYQQLSALSAKFVAFAHDVMAQPQWQSNQEMADRLLKREQQLLLSLSSLDEQGASMSAGSMDGYQRLKYVDALMVGLLGVIAQSRAIAVRSPALGQQVADSEAYRLLMLGVSGDYHDILRLQQAVAELKQLLGEDAARLGEQVDYVVNALIAIYGASAAAEAGAFVSKAVVKGRPKEWGLVIQAGILSGVATFLAGTCAYFTGMVVAEMSALGVCLFSMVLGSMPQPQKMAPVLFLGVFSGVVVATGYRLLVQPYINSELMLLLTLLPFCLFGGMARVAGKTRMAALDGNMCFMLASQAGMASAAVSEVFIGSAALILGAGVVALWFVLVPRNSGKLALTVRRRVYLDLQRLLQGQDRDTTEQWSAHSARLMIRVALYLGRSGKTNILDLQRGALSPISVGVSVRELVRLSLQPKGQQQASAQALLNILSQNADQPKQAVQEIEQYLQQHLNQLPDQVRDCAVDLSDALQRSLPYWQH